MLRIEITGGGFDSFYMQKGNYCGGDFICKKGKTSGGKGPIHLLKIPQGILSISCLILFVISSVVDSKLLSSETC